MNTVSDTYRETFIAAYLECALWSSNDDEGNPLDDNHSPSDIDSDSLIRMRLECDAFISEQASNLEGLDPGQSGHDFWLTRNGHGAGFWDRGLGEVGERLSEASQVYGEVYLYVGSGDKIYCD